MTGGIAILIHTEPTTPAKEHTELVGSGEME